jgi:hypothetical protein
LKEAFSGNRDLFKGLYLEDHWDWSVTHPVIKIDFGGGVLKEAPKLTEKIHEILNLNSERESIKLETPSISGKFYELITKLEKKYSEKVVILIDEYDKPLIDYLDKDNLYKALENRDILKSFYSVLKDADAHLKLVFITGVSKFSKVSIFSDLNNLNDISLTTAYNEICGISQKELEENFNDELEIYDREKIKTWYNGYKWDVDGATVYNPFSLLVFLSIMGNIKTFGTPQEHLHS